MARVSRISSVAYEYAQEEARKRSWQYVEKEHLFIGILSIEKAKILFTPARLGMDRHVSDDEAECNGIKELFGRFDIDAAALRRTLRGRLPRGAFHHSGDEILSQSEECGALNLRSAQIGRGEINSFSVFAAILEDPGELIRSLLCEFIIEPRFLLKQTLAAQTEAKKNYSPSTVYEWTTE